MKEFSVEEAAEYLGLKLDSIRKLAQRGILQGEKRAVLHSIKDRWFFSQETLDTYIANPPKRGWREGASREGQKVGPQKKINLCRMELLPILEKRDWKIVGDYLWQKGALQLNLTETKGQGTRKHIFIKVTEGDKMVLDVEYKKEMDFTAIKQL